MRISFLPAHAHLIFACACAHFFRTAHAHLILVCTCASQFGLRVRIHFWLAHAHFIFTCSCASHLACACAPHLVLRMSISFWHVQAHLFLACACASHLELLMRMVFWPAHGLRILTLHMRTSFTPALAQLILSFAFAFVLPAHDFFLLCSVCAYHFALPLA